MSEEEKARAAAEATTDEALLKECREDFMYAKSYWQENYDESKKDMDAVLCIPPESFRNDRAGRPCLWPDELSQYINQTNNNLRQTKRAIKVSPRNEEAKDQDAEHRQAYIQGIEYASKAQSIYATAFESTVECGFGFWRVNLLVTGPKGEQEPRIRRIPNWSTVLPDPDAKEADFSDAMLYFVTDSMRQTVFARRYPKAKKRSFEGADIQLAPGWFNGENITVAEWWKRREITGAEWRKRAAELGYGAPEEGAGEGKETDEADGIKHWAVTQRITNGLEILETHEWIGSWIPIIGCFGLEKYKSDGNTAKRLFLSLIRRARDSQQMLAYIASQEAEEFGMAPRAPLMGFKGMFDPDKHKFIHKQPMAYIEVNVPDDWNPQWGPPPIPTRPQFQPNAQAYESAFQQWRMSIQAAVGVTPLPTAAQRATEKSGIALQRIQSQESMGSFHFTDNFVRALTNTGIQINELITELAKLDSLPQTVLGKDQKGADIQMKIAQQPAAPGSGEAAGEGAPADADSQQLPEEKLFFAHRGEFEVAISDGPSEMSQRDEVSDFVDTLLTSLPQLQIPPPLLQQIVAIAIRLKNIGTYGDEIADLLAPPQGQEVPPQARAMVLQLQGQLKAAQAEIQQLSLEKMAKITEFQGKMALADKQQETQMLVAEITTRAQNLNERMSAFEDMMKQWHSQAHDLALQMQQQGAAQAAQAAQPLAPGAATPPNGGAPGNAPPAPQISQ